MSGPPYPRPNPAPGSNAIGSFAIGISPIGTISTYDFWATVISQYSNSPALTAIIESFNDAMDQTANLENFYDFVWNIATAEGWGLDVWGRIVGVSRTIPLPGAIEHFGFGEAGDSWTGFGQGGFYTGAGVSNNFILSDDDFRVLILAKAAGNISDGSILSLNDILMTLFPNLGSAYVVDNQDMTMDLHFTFPLTQVQLAIVSKAGVLPIPSGVVMNIVQP